MILILIVAKYLSSSDRLFILGGKTAVYSADNNWVGTSFGDFQSILGKLFALIYCEINNLAFFLLVFDTLSHQASTMATIGDIPPARYRFCFF